MGIYKTAYPAQIKTSAVSSKVKASNWKFSKIITIDSNGQLFLLAHGQPVARAIRACKGFAHLYKLRKQIRNIIRIKHVQLEMYRQRIACFPVGRFIAALMKIAKACRKFTHRWRSDGEAAFILRCIFYD